MYNQDDGLFNNSSLDIMSVLGFAISIYNLILNEKQISNDELAKEVQTNRDKINEQNDKYLETIIEQNNQIINLLKGKQKWK